MVLGQIQDYRWLHSIVISYGNSQKEEKHIHYYYKFTYLPFIIKKHSPLLKNHNPLLFSFHFLPFWWVAMYFVFFQKAPPWQPAAVQPCLRAQDNGFHPESWYRKKVIHDDSVGLLLWLWKLNKYSKLWFYMVKWWLMCG